MPLRKTKKALITPAISPAEEPPVQHKQPEPPVSTLQKLIVGPQELWLMILSELDFTDLKTLRSINKFLEEHFNSQMFASAVIFIDIRCLKDLEVSSKKPSMSQCLQHLRFDTRCMSEKYLHLGRNYEKSVEKKRQDDIEYNFEEWTEKGTRILANALRNFKNLACIELNDKNSGKSMPEYAITRRNRFPREFPGGITGLQYRFMMHAIALASPDFKLSQLKIVEITDYANMMCIPYQWIPHIKPGYTHIRRLDLNFTKGFFCINAQDLVENAPGYISFHETLKMMPELEDIKVHLKANSRISLPDDMYWPALRSIDLSGCGVSATFDKFCERHSESLHTVMLRSCWFKDVTANFWKLLRIRARVQSFVVLDKLLYHPNRPVGYRYYKSLDRSEAFEASGMREGGKTQDIDAFITRKTSQLPEWLRNL